MPETKLRRWYLMFNYTIAGIVLAIFVLAEIHQPQYGRFSKVCVHAKLLGSTCPVCGSGEGLSFLIRGDLIDAREIQPNSFPVFIFFCILLMLRIVFVFLLTKTKIPANVIAGIDLTIAFVVFIWAFKSIIPTCIYIFYKMLLTGNIA